MAFRKPADWQGVATGTRDCRATKAAWGCRAIVVAASDDAGSAPWTTHPRTPRMLSSLRRPLRSAPARSSAVMVSEAIRHAQGRGMHIEVPLQHGGRVSSDKGVIGCGCPAICRR